MTEELKKPSPKHQARTSPELELPNVCEGIIPWYQEEVYRLAKSMSDETDKMIIDLALKGEIK